uniref:Putative secreted protein n=1 Tax=Anopheles darlingi TaxID=43151 RepID=A0A2M4DBI9_ANODA
MPCSNSSFVAAVLLELATIFALDEASSVTARSMREASRALEQLVEGRMTLPLGLPPPPTPPAGTAPSVVATICCRSNARSAFTSCARCLRSSSRIRISRASARACRIAARRASPSLAI